MKVSPSDLLFFVLSSTVIATQTMTEIPAPMLEGWQTVGDKTSSKLLDDGALEDEWSLWFERKDQEKTGQSELDYLNSLLNVGAFKTLKGFLTKWDTVHGPNSAPGNVHIFKNGVRPIWEDEYNINGGKWVITLLKGEEEQPALKMWLALVVAVLTEQLGYADQICGVVLSLKQWGTSLHVWNRNADDYEQQEQVKHKLTKLLKAKKVKYVRHRTSLKKIIEAHHDGDKKGKEFGKGKSERQGSPLDMLDTPVSSWDSCGSLEATHSSPR